MLHVYSEASTHAENVEKFFNSHVRRFKHMGEPEAKLIYTFGRNVYLGNGMIETPFGKGSLIDLPISAKTALCLTEFPSLLFKLEGCSNKDVERLLNLPEGCLCIELSEPFGYYFPIQVIADNRTVVTSSTDLMIYLQKGKS